MRKLFSFLLLVCLAFLIVGCKAEVVDEEKEVLMVLNQVNSIEKEYVSFLKSLDNAHNSDDQEYVAQELANAQDSLESLKQNAYALYVPSFLSDNERQDLYDCREALIVSSESLYRASVFELRFQFGDTTLSPLDADKFLEDLEKFDEYSDKYFYLKEKVFTELVDKYID